MTWEEAINHINSVSRYGNKPGVECTKAVLDKLGNPEQKLKIIHVAGTNGKGSTCMYLASILMECGLKTGVFTSPHLIRENERIRIDGKDISDEDFLKYYELVHKAELELIQEGFGQISYFDFFVAIAFLYYAHENTDAVIMETGLGGRLDSTNAVESPILTIITSISLDHVAILGNTVEKIAAEKAGIIKPSAPLVYIAGEPYSHVIEKRAKEAGIFAYGVEKGQCEIRENAVKHIDFSLNNIYYKDNVFRISTPAKYQVMNASLALTAAGVLKDNGTFGSAISELGQKEWLECIRRAIAGTSWEGRMELIAPGIYVDGAHNPDGIASFLETAGSMKELTGGAFALLFSAVNDKNYDCMIEEICKSRIFDAFVVTQIEGARCLSAGKIAEEFGKYTDTPVIAEADISEAVNVGRTACGKDTTLFCAGSLYLAGEVRKAGLSL
ncbi:MAG: bifunctional folylpolyglutamate synthase/dihydrofolate synthase [Clostridia bacterium]|nr:bifunctional folylpolyglutamate synthase/dihydrofolate synthase [Clostridia bacterium]